MNIYFLGFAVLIFTAVALPINFTTLHGNALNAAFPIAGLMCCIWCLELLALRRQSNFEASRVAISAVSFIAIAIVSFIAGQYPWFTSPGASLGAQIAGLGLMVLSFGLFLVTGHQIRQIYYLQWLTWLFLVAGGLFCISQTVPGLEFASRWSSPSSVGSMFWIWLVAVGSSQAIFNRDLSGPVRIVCLCLALLGLYRGLFLTASWASGWLPPLVAIAVIFLFRVPRTTVGLGLLAIPGGIYAASRITTLVMTGEQYSWLTRMEALKVLWQLFERNPISGLGPANYYYYTPLYPIIGWYVNFSSHNNYMDLLLQTGILGLLAFIWFLFEIIRIILRLLKSEAAGYFERAFLIGALGGLSGALVSGTLADWILPFYYNIGLMGFRSSFLFWFFLGGVLALNLIMNAPRAKRLAS